MEINSTLIYKKIFLLLHPNASIHDMGSNEEDMEMKNVKVLTTSFIHLFVCKENFASAHFNSGNT